MKTDWPGILGYVSNAIEVTRKSGETLWFRGHRATDWKLRSTLHRYVIRIFAAAGREIGGVPSPEARVQLRGNFKGFYNEFVTNIWDLLQQEERTQWGLVFSMQHHGIPTRLLDCTHSFACALYFAQYERNRDEDAAIFLIRPEELNAANPLIKERQLVALRDESPNYMSTSQTELYHPGITVEGINYERLPMLPPMAITPTITNTRMRAQQARFILAGDSFTPIEEQVPTAFEKIILPAKIFDDVEVWLRLVGLHHFVYFPDLEGLSKDIERKGQAIVEAVKAIVEEQRTATGEGSTS